MLKRKKTAKKNAGVVFMLHLHFFLTLKLLESCKKETAFYLCVLVRI